MILVFKDTQVYRDCWETDTKSIENSAVYNWATSYVVRKDYLIRDADPLPYITIDTAYHGDDDYLVDDLFEAEVFSSPIATKVMVTMALELNLGLDLVFLCTHHNPKFHVTLERYLKLFQHRYGVTAREIQSKDDIPEFPLDCDSFGKNGIVNFKIDYPMVQQVVDEYCRDPIIARVARDQFKKLELSL